MSTRHRLADVRKALNTNGIAKPRDLKEGLRYTVPDRSQLVDSKWRDVRVVEGARLESDSGELHRATPKYLSTIDSTTSRRRMPLDVSP
jgi:hypothetical protein